MMKQGDGMGSYTLSTNDGRDLPGYRKKSFSLPFAGGEIWFEHIDGLYHFEELALEKLESDMPSIIRPSAPSSVAIMVDETDISDGISDAVCDIILNKGKRFMKVAFVGADRPTVRMIKKRLDARDFALEFFNDTEKAKGWLVREK